MYLVTGSEMRRLEKQAMESLGIPSLLLMENAAQQAVGHCIRLLADKDPRKGVVLVCGFGNNGGDGFAMARLLSVKGIRSEVVLAGDADGVKGDAKVNLDILRRMGVPIHTQDAMFRMNEDESSLKKLFASAALLVDALFGTGLSDRPPTGFCEQLIQQMNQAPCAILSVDIPSGVDAGTGRVPGCAVKAHTTVTFGLPKAGLFFYPGASFAGDIRVEDISIPSPFLKPEKPTIEMLRDEDIAGLLPARPARSHKGSFGQVCLLAGSEAMPGAAALCGMAAYRIGAGLVNACVLPAVARVLHSQLREAITTLVPGENGCYGTAHFDRVEEAMARARVIVVGPGLGRGESVTRFVLGVLERASVPVVLDADGLTAAAEEVSVFSRLKAPCVITPHPGEMSRLIRQPVSAITEDIRGVAEAFSTQYPVITVLKDARTVIASPEGRTFVNTTGSAALAKAGSGDVLTGMIAGLIAQGSDSLQAAALGTFLHGKTGEVLSKDLSLYGVLAGDIAEKIPLALQRFLKTV